jgi:hypothetical protein
VPIIEHEVKGRAARRCCPRPPAPPCWSSGHEGARIIDRTNTPQPYQHRQGEGRRTTGDPSTTVAPGKR